MRRKKDKSNGITALYERLSRDDDNAGESNSIVHQKQMLEDYAMKHGFTNLVHFTDDGWSGATFDRPSWNRLVEGVKNGEITACICKDMSRIGRDHLQVGFFTDILFREKEVRFIAINNGIDSDRPLFSLPLILLPMPVQHWAFLLILKTYCSSPFQKGQPFHKLSLFCSILLFLLHPLHLHLH